MMKNKYLEALNNLKEEIKINTPTITRQNELLKDIDILQELIDKENPMKVVFEPNGSPIKSARCPKCNGLIHFGFETYCCYCGTKISWE